MDVARIQALRQSTNAWQLALRPAPKRADPSGRYRVLLIVSPGANTIRHMEALAAGLDAATLARALEAAMLPPASAELVAARPPSIMVDDDALVALLTPLLSPCGVAVERVEALTGIEPVMVALAERDEVFSSKAPTVRAEAVAADPVEPSDDEDALPALIEVEHAVSTTTLPATMLAKLAPDDSEPDHSCLVIRCVEPYADAIVAAVRRVDAISFVASESDERRFEVVLAHAEGKLLGALTFCPLTDDRSPLATQLGERPLLAVAVGPPARLRTHEIRSIRRVTHLRAASDDA